MTILLLEFLVFISLVVVVAWEPRPRSLIDLLVTCKIRRIALVVVIAWILLILAFWWLFRTEPFFWQLVALLVELAGVIYLAREVYVAQSSEEYRRTAEALKPFIDLEHLVAQGEFEEYVREYYKLDGRSPKTANVDIAVAKLFGNLPTKVNNLKSLTRRVFERPDGPLADQTFSYRRARLLLGVALVSLGLAGHGIHILAVPEEASSFEGILQETRAELSKVVSDIGHDRTETREQVSYLEEKVTSQGAAIASLAAENKRWHVRRAGPRQGSTPAASNNCSCESANTPRSK